MKKINDKNKYSIIVESSDWGKIIEARKSGVSWDELRTRTGFPALGMAIISGSALAVQTMLSSGAPIETEIMPNGDKFSPLWTAIEQGNPDMMDYLLQAGSDPNEVSDEFGEPLKYVSSKAMAEETVVLCRHGAKPNSGGHPSPLWSWIDNLSPTPSIEQGVWEIPDTKPILALLSCGARVDMEVDVPFALQQWQRLPLNKESEQAVTMIISIMERNALEAVAGGAGANKKKEHII